MTPTSPASDSAKSASTPAPTARKSGPIETVRALLDRSKQELAAAAAGAMPVDRIMRVALTELRQTPDLQECDPVSFVGAVMMSTQLGLEIGRTLGEAYLVPRWNSRRRQLEVHFQPGYRGLIKLARNSKEIATVEAHVVYERDEFDFAYGSKPYIVHKPALAADRGPRRCVYAIAQLTNGHAQFIVLHPAEIERIKGFVAGQSRDGQLKDSSPWVQWEDAMWQKTAARRLVNWLPADTRLATAANLDALHEAGEAQQLADLVTDVRKAGGLDELDLAPALVDRIYGAFETLGLSNAERTLKLTEYRGREEQLAEWAEAEVGRKGSTTPIPTNVPTSAEPPAARVDPIVGQLADASAKPATVEPARAATPAVVQNVATITPADRDKTASTRTGGRFDF